jgi:hypothetical protein
VQLFQLLTSSCRNTSAYRTQLRDNWNKIGHQIWKLLGLFELSYIKKTRGVYFRKLIQTRSIGNKNQQKYFIYEYNKQLTHQVPLD